MTVSKWPVRLIPRRSPPFWMGLLICVASVGTAMVVRGVLLGFVLLIATQERDQEKHASHR